MRLRALDAGPALVEARLAGLDRGLVQQDRGLPYNRHWPPCLGTFHARLAPKILEKTEGQGFEFRPYRQNPLIKVKSAAGDDN